MKNAISWFEIPTVDLDRATKFYESIFDIQLIPMDTPNLKMRVFPTEAMGVGGAIVYSEHDFYKVSDKEGTLVYLNANPDVQIVLDRVEEAGGSILVPKTSVSDEIGHIAVIRDCEGNRVALHSIPPQ